MRVAMGSDHAGFELRRQLATFVAKLGHEVVDVGTDSPDSVDYPVFGVAVANLVASGDCERGIAICGTGVGIGIAANKVHGVRAVICSEPYSARMARQHNNANVLAIGARVVGLGLAEDIVTQWLSAEFEGGRHARRVDQLGALDAGQPLC